MRTLNEWLTVNERLCEETPIDELTIDRDPRPGGGDQIVLKNAPTHTVAFMSTGWNPEDKDDCMNPWAEFFIKSRPSLWTALKIIGALLAANEDQPIPPRHAERIADAIINERDAICKPKL